MVGITDPAPSSVIVTLIALPPKVFPLTVTGVMPHMLPLWLLSVTADGLVQPHETSKKLPVIAHPEAFLTVIVWLPLATFIKEDPLWYNPPSSLYSRPGPMGLVTFTTALPFPSVQSIDTTGLAGAVFGAAVPLPGELVHPLTVVVTV